MIVCTKHKLKSEQTKKDGMDTAGNATTNGTTKGDAGATNGVAGTTNGVAGTTNGSRGPLLRLKGIGMH